MFRLGIVSVLIVCLLYGFRAQLLPSLARFLDVSQPPEAADYVFVLAGNLEARPFVAAALWRAGLTKHIVITTPKMGPEMEDGILLPKHEISRRVLSARGVPDEAIIRLKRECSTTFDEAQALAEFLETRPNSSILVVTNGFHTRRSRWILHKVAGNYIQSLRFVTAPTDVYDETNWWHSDRGFTTYLSEYVKLVYYYLRY